MAWTAVGIGASLLGNALGANAQKKAAKVADQRLVEGRDIAVNQSGLKDYAGAGVAANNAQAGALGLNGLPAQQEAFNNYLNSTGYQTQLQAGQQAVTGSAAAKGLLNSGATLKALQRTGAGIGQNFYNAYLGQVGDVANRGLSAAGNIAGAATGTGVNLANVAQGVGQAQANAYGDVAADIGRFGGRIASNGGKIF